MSASPYGREPAPRGPVEVRVGGRNNLLRWSLIGCVLGVGFLQLIVAVVASGPMRVALFFVLPGLAAVYLAALALWVVRTRKVLTVDRAGLSCRRRRGAALWSVSWSELRGVAVTTAYWISRGRRHYRTRMMLIPQRPAAAGWAAGTSDSWARLAENEGRYGAHPGDVGVPLALYADLRKLDAALRAYAGPLYLGMTREGMITLESLD